MAGMVENGITIKFNADLTGLSSGIDAAKSILGGFASSISAISSDISQSFSQAFSSLSNLPSLDMSGLTEGSTQAAQDLLSLQSDAQETISSLSELGNEGMDAGEKLTEAGAGSASFKDSLNMISSSLQQLGSNIGGVIAGRLSILAGGIQQVGINIANAASGPINNFIDKIQSLATSINNAVSGPINNFTDKVQNIYSSAVNVASNALLNFTANVAAVGSVISDAVSGPINAFTDGVQRVASTISDTATSAFNNFTSGIQKIGSNISDAVSGPVNNFTNAVQKIGSNISDAVSGPINSFTSGVQQVGSKISDAVSGPFNAFANSIKSFASDIEDAASGPLADLISGIKSLSSNISDAASGPLDKLSSGVQSAFSGMKNLAGNALDSIKNSFSTSADGMKDFLGGIKDTASGVLDFASSIGDGISSLYNFGQTAVSTAASLLEPAANAETMQTAFETLMGSTKAASDEMQQFNAFAAKTPFKTMDIDQAASQLIGFGINAKDVVPDLTAIGDSLSAVGKGSAANMMGVVNIFGKIQTSGGLTVGTMQELSRYGVNAWDILEKQTGKTKDQLTKMIQQGLFPAKDAMGLLAKGIEANPLYSGGMAKQSSTAAGLISTLQSNWTQLLATLGTPILKAIEGDLGHVGDLLSSQAFKDFASNVGQKIADAFQGIGNLLKSIDWGTFGNDFAYLGQQLAPIITGLKPVSSTIFDTVGGVLKNVVKDVGDFAKHIGDVVKWFKDGSAPATILKDALIGIGIAFGLMKIGQFVAALPGLVAGIWGWATAQGGVAIATLLTALPYILIGALVVGIIALIILAVQHWGDIVKWLTGVWSAVAGFFEWLWGQIAGFFVGVGQWFADRFNEAKNAVVVAFGAIGQWFGDRWHDIQNAFGAVGKWFQDLWQGIVDDFNSILGGLGKLAGNIWNGITDAVKAGFNFVIDLINNVIRTIDNIKVGGFGVNIPLIPHLASGVENFVGGLALVGEKGPELVSLPRGANVLNAFGTENFFKGMSLAKPAAMNSAAFVGARSSAQSQPAPIIVHVQSPDIYMDHKKVTDIVASRLSDKIRMKGGVRAH